MDCAAKEGIIMGRDGGNFATQGTATRAEAAVILERLIKNITFPDCNASIASTKHLSVSERQQITH